MSSVAGVGVAVGLLAAVGLAALAWAVRQQAVAVAAGVPLLVSVGLAGWQGWLDAPVALAGVAVATLVFSEVSRLAVDLRRRGGPIAVEPAVRRAVVGALVLPVATALVAGALVAAVDLAEPVAVDAGGVDGRVGLPACGGQVALHGGLIAIALDEQVPVPVPGVALGQREVRRRVGDQRSTAFVAAAEG